MVLGDDDDDDVGLVDVALVDGVLVAEASGADTVSNRAGRSIPGFQRRCTIRSCIVVVLQRLQRGNLGRTQIHLQRQQCNGMAAARTNELSVSSIEQKINGAACVWLRVCCWTRERKKGAVWGCCCSVHSSLPSGFTAKAATSCIY